MREMRSLREECLRITCDNECKTLIFIYSIYLRLAFHVCVYQHATRVSLPWLQRTFHLHFQKGGIFAMTSQ